MCPDCAQGRGGSARMQRVHTADVKMVKAVVRARTASQEHCWRRSKATAGRPRRPGPPPARSSAVGTVRPEPHAHSRRGHRIETSAWHSRRAPRGGRGPVDTKRKRVAQRRRRPDLGEQPEPPRLITTLHVPPGGQVGRGHRRGARSALTPTPRLGNTTIRPRVDRASWALTLTPAASPCSLVCCSDLPAWAAPPSPSRCPRSQLTWT